MGSVKAYGQFEKRNGYTYRTRAYLQWGTSVKSLGAFLLLNPGKAKPIEDVVLKEGDAYFGETKIDQSMQQMQKLVERVNAEKELDGRVHIYNLFSLRNTKYQDAIAMFEKLVSVGEIPVIDDYPSLEELKKHPWICKCWGINSNANRNHLRERKIKWNELLTNANVPTFGKLHPNKFDYFHIRPHLKKDQDVLQEELVELYRKEVARKLVHNYS
ncbi:hypothetical protein [Psychrobacillus sp. BM2]|uniref:hypothetical protein n=1 Tax=Psychrobacillus sp. BM2 TaxID=3400421 RepID=UPI003B02B0A2